MPVVVYVDGGDDLDSEAEEKLQPSAALAKSQSVVFVKVNYRYSHTIHTIGMSGMQQGGERPQKVRSCTV